MDIFSDRFIPEPLLARHLIDAQRTSTSHAQGVAGIDAFMPVLPANPDLVLGWAGNLCYLRSIGGGSPHIEGADLRGDILGESKEGTGAWGIRHGLDNREIGRAHV